MNTTASSTIELTIKDNPEHRSQVIAKSRRSPQRVSSRSRSVKEQKDALEKNNLFRKRNKKLVNKNFLKKIILTKKKEEEKTSKISNNTKKAYQKHKKEEEEKNPHINIPTTTHPTNQQKIKAKELLKKKQNKSENYLREHCHQESPNDDENIQTSIDHTPGTTNNTVGDEFNTPDKQKKKASDFIDISDTLQITKSNLVDKEFGSIDQNLIQTTKHSQKTSRVQRAKKKRTFGSNNKPDTTLNSHNTTSVDSSPSECPTLSLQSISISKTKKKNRLKHIDTSTKEDETTNKPNEADIEDCTATYTADSNSNHSDANNKQKSDEIIQVDNKIKEKASDAIDVKENDENENNPNDDKPTKLNTSDCIDVAESEQSMNEIHSELKDASTVSTTLSTVMSELYPLNNEDAVEETKNDNCRCWSIISAISGFILLFAAYYFGNNVLEEMTSLYEKCKQDIDTFMTYNPLETEFKLNEKYSSIATYLDAFNEKKSDTKCKWLTQSKVQTLFEETIKQTYKKKLDKFFDEYSGYMTNQHQKQNKIENKNDAVALRKRFSICQKFYENEINYNPLAKYYQKKKSELESNEELIPTYINLKWSGKLPDRSLKFEGRYTFIKYDFIDGYGYRPVYERDSDSWTQLMFQGHKWVLDSHGMAQVKWENSADILHPEQLGPSNPPMYTRLKNLEVVITKEIFPLS